MPQDDSSLSLYIRFELSLLVSSFRERLKRILEGGNIPPQRPLACSPQILEKHRAGHYVPQTTSLSFSSTRRLVKVAPIRLLRGMSFGKYINSYTSRKRGRK